MAAALVVAALVATSVSSVGSVGAAASPPRGAADPQVISDWNAVAYDTIIVDAGKQNAEAFMWFAFEQAAVYNAVVGITRQYELYNWNRRGPRGASPQAAAAVAAHDVLLEYFPASEIKLDSALAASLAEVPDGPPKDQGIRYGERAADRLIDLREDDGRNAPITFDVPPAPGVWRPTPPAFMAFFDPWMAQVEPLLLDSPSQFRPGPPPALTSATYTEDFNEVKDVGSSTSTVRTPEQTATARFMALASFQLVSSSMQDLAARYQLDISDSARLFAAVDMSAADGLIASWDAKLEFGFWRPITAIQLADTDGNPETDPDPNWASLLRDSSLSRLHQRAHHDHGRGHPRPDRSPRPRGGSHRPEHHGGGCHPPLRDRVSAPAGRPSMPGCGRASTSEPQTWSATKRARRSATGRSTTTSSQPTSDRRGSSRPGSWVVRLDGREGA